MPGNEYEIIHWERIRHIHCFIVGITYRNPHAHKELELCLVLEGTGSVQIGSATFPVDAGSLILTNSNKPHEIRSSGRDPVVILSIQISPHFCLEYFPFFRNVEFTPEHADINRQLTPEQRELLQTLMTDAARSYLEESLPNRFHCVGGVMEILAFLFATIPYRVIDEKDYRSKKEKAARILRVTNYIEHNYHRKLLLREIAEQEGLTVSYLSDFIRKNLNITFQEYVNNIRFERALHLIGHSNMQLLDICMESGFSDSKYLNHMFLKNFGCTPSQYRKHTAPPAASPSVSPLTQSFYSEEQSRRMLGSDSL